MRSVVQQRGAVKFAPFTGERIYMREFTKRDGLPADLARWRPTVDAMLAGIDVNGPMYLMVDQGLVRRGQTHRRPGLHVDGYWNPTKYAHGHQMGPRHGLAGAAEAILLASDVVGCQAYIGETRDFPGDDGNCSHISTHRMLPILMTSGFCYAGNALMLHESLAANADCRRTVVRINVPGWSP